MQIVEHIREMRMSSLLNMLHQPRLTPAGWVSKCPACQAASSMTASKGRVGISLSCREGCSQAEIAAAMGLAVNNLFSRIERKAIPTSITVVVDGDNAQAAIDVWRKRKQEGAANFTDTLKYLEARSVQASKD